MIHIIIIVHRNTSFLIVQRGIALLFYVALCVENSSSRIEFGSSDVFSSSKQDGGSGRLSISRTAAYFHIKFTASKSAKPFHLSVNSALSFFFSSTFLRNVLFLFSSGQNTGIKKKPVPFRGTRRPSIRIRLSLFPRSFSYRFSIPPHLSWLFHISAGILISPLFQQSC